MWLADFTAFTLYKQAPNKLLGRPSACAHLRTLAKSV